MIVVFIVVLVMWLYRLERVVFSDDAFYAIIIVSWLVLMFIDVETFDNRRGCEHSFIFSKHLSDLVMNLFGEKENFL